MTLPMRDCARCDGAGELYHRTSAGHDWDASPCPAGCEGGLVVDEEKLCPCCGEREATVDVHYIDPRRNPGMQRECSECVDARRCEECERLVYFEHVNLCGDDPVCYACCPDSAPHLERIAWIEAEGEAA